MTWLLALVVSTGVLSQSTAPSESEFQFIRIRYNGFKLGGVEGSGFQPPWAHDYPRAERNLLKLLSERTSVRTTPHSHAVLNMEDSEIENYPFLYVSEPGFWDVTKAEAENLRNYLDGGGFVLFDDFRGQDNWSNLVHCMKQVLPDRKFRKLSVDEPVFQSFYKLESLDLQAPYQVPGKPAFYGIHDTSGRLQVMAAFNNDIGDLWEWSDEDHFPEKLADQANKLGINIVLYALKKPE